MRGSAPKSQLPSDAQSSPATEDANRAGASDADATADALIRKMMVDQKREVSREALPELLPDADPAPEKRVRHPRRLFKKREAKPLDKAQVQSEAMTPKSPGKISRAFRARCASIRGYRPNAKHAFFAVIALIFYLRPWLIPITLTATFLIILIAYLSLGPDRVAELVVAGWRRLHSRRPKLAEDIRLRADAMAVRIDAALDRLPGSWSDQIHVPDFSQNQGFAADRPDPFERLAKEAQQG